MNESGHVGVIGALLAKNASNPLSGRPTPGRDTADFGADGTAGSDPFGEFFQSSGNRDQSLARTGALKTQNPAESIDVGQAGLVAEVATTDGRDKTANEPGGFNLQFSEHAVRTGEKHAQFHYGRVAPGALNQYVTTIDGGLNAGRLNALDRALGNQQVSDASLAEIKLAGLPGRGDEASLATIKVGDPVLAGDEFRRLDARRNGAITFTLQPGSAPGAIGRSVSALGALSQFDSALPELSPGSERLLELRSAISERGLVAARSSQKPQTFQAVSSLKDAYSFFGSSPTAGANSLGTSTESEIVFDPALSPNSASTRAIGGPTFVASLTAQSFAGHAGVLPQIQAAVLAHNGRDTIEVRLDPPDLGRVRIDFSVEGADAIKAVIGADRSETLDHLRRNIADLEQQLRQAGFGSISFEFRSNGDRRFASDRDDPATAASTDGTNAGADISNKIYLSLRENAQLDLLL